MSQQTVFITGSSTGLGRAAALLFAQKGWPVIVQGDGGVHGHGSPGWQFHGEADCQVVWEAATDSKD